MDEQAVLVISYIGHKNQEVPVKGNTSLNIVLMEDAQTLDEVVVVGYGKQKKVNLTGSVGVIDANQLNNRSISSVEEAIQGQIPGLKVVRTSGQPGNRNNG